MILCDASPLVALINQKDKKHALCLATLPQLTTPLLTTWPCMAEAMYLLHSYGGNPAQKALWDYAKDGVLAFHHLTLSDQKRMQLLMEHYRDRPMDLADASLVAAAEALNTYRIFTLDRDFYIYRFKGSGTFEVIP